MSEARISHEDLSEFADHLRGLRDEAKEDKVRAEDQDAPLEVVRGFDGQARAYALSLSALHICSHGHYGERLKQQRGDES